MTMIPILCFCALLSVARASLDDLIVTFDPPGTIKVREDEAVNVSILIESNATDAVQLRKADFHLNNSEFRVAELLPASLNLSDLELPINETISLRGIFVGTAQLSLVLKAENDERREWSGYAVGVMRPKSSEKATTVFIAVAATLSFVNNALMGIQLDRHVIWSIVKKPIVPAIGLFCQFGLMAPLAFGWGQALLAPNVPHMFSLFLIGSCPGGGQSNKMTLLMDGNLDLSITLTFFSSILSLLMLPFWVYTLGSYYTSRLGLGNTSIEIPFGNIILTLVMSIVPAFIGMLIRHFRPHWAKKTLKLVKWSSFFIAIGIVPAAIYINLYIFSYFTWRTMLAGLSLPLSGFLIALVAGYAVSLLPGRGGLSKAYPDAICLAIETAIQNFSIANLILRTTLPSPENELVLVVPICFIIFSGLPIWLLLLVRTIYKRFCRSKQARDEEPPKSQMKLDEDDVPSPLGVLVQKLRRFVSSRRAIRPSALDLSTIKTGQNDTKPTKDT